MCEHWYGTVTKVEEMELGAFSIRVDTDKGDVAYSLPPAGYRDYPMEGDELLMVFKGPGTPGTEGNYRVTYWREGLIRGQYSVYLTSVKKE